MKTLKKFVLAAAVVLGLGLAPAHAEGVAAPACGGVPAVSAAVQGPAGKAVALPSPGLMSRSAAPLPPRGPQAEGVSDAFLAAIGEGGSLRPTPSPGICYAFPCVICCCDGSGNCECTFTC